MEPKDDDVQNSSEAKTLHPVEFSNYDCEINEEFSRYLKEAGFDGFGFNFNVVTILGSQSSGKSHLLNKLFASKFETMDARKGHSQTTKGIWASLVVPKDKSANAVVVFDSEGTDSRERGEGRLTFEHRSALFCLALSDAVVVNLWYNSLGNLTGSNYGLLKTVVEANLDLTDSNNDEKSKTILLFCVRDWSPDLSPLDVVEDYILNKYMKGIWKEITKPERFANLGVESLFDIRVFGLANAVTQTETFNGDLEVVKTTWNELKPEKFSRMVPSDGFFVYSKNVWKTIIEQNHLDIPSQKEMLSSYRCSEIKNALLERLSNNLKEVDEKEFKEYATNLLKKAEEEYFAESSRYDQVVAERVAKELLQQLCSKMQGNFETALQKQVNKRAEEALGLLDKEFSVSVQGRELVVGGGKPSESWTHFGKKCQEMETVQVEELEGHLKLFNVEHEGKVAFKHEFDTQTLKENLRVSLANGCELLRSRHLELFKEELNKLCSSCFVLVKSNLMEKTLKDEEFWSYFEQLLDETYKNCMDIYRQSYLGLVNEPAKNEFEYLTLVLLMKSTKENFDQIKKNMEQYVWERFDKYFNYHEFKGELVPTEWHKQSEQELNNRYKQSKEDALYLLKVFKMSKKRKLPEFDFEQVKKNHHFCRTLAEEVDRSYSELLSEQEVLETTQSCNKKFLEAYKNAQVVQTAGTSGNSWRNIPPMFWLALLVLGWNELRAAFKVLLKFQLIIPLLLFFYFGLNYMSNTFLGPEAQRFIKPLKKKAVKAFTTSLGWVLKTVHGFSARARTHRTPRSNFRRHDL